MSQDSNQAFLLKDFQAYCFFGCIKTQEDNGSFYLHEAKQKKFEVHRERFIPKDDVSDLIDKSLSSSKTMTYIELSLKYDSTNKVFKPQLNFVFDNVFIRKLDRGLTSSPTIGIEGEAEFCKSGMTCSPENRTIKFSISEVALENQTIPDFKGSSEFSKYFDELETTQSSILVRLKYSISFSWKKVVAGDYRLQREKLNMLETLWKDRLLSDCIIVASNKTEVKCHRSILAAQSDVFRAMFESELQESQTNRIEMGDMSEQGVNALLAYFYTWDIKIEELSEEVCVELLYAAHKYNISTLESLMIDTLLDKPDGEDGNQWFSPNIALELYFLGVNIESCNLLTEKMLSILKRNGKKLMDSVTFTELKTRNPSQIAILEATLQELELK
ncbi:unnamed protein product [Orchesella dallaii]|uniref:BTB domain-containing protein n=1 Tax=Orchesella dallaii TaxID=48710 RepID=A0ABP1RUB8_9HEXA